MAVFSRLGSNLASRSMGPSRLEKEKTFMNVANTMPRMDSRFIEMRHVGHVHQRHNMERKLQHDGEEDVKIKDVAERSLP
jgi:hypothetical protein